MAVQPSLKGRLIVRVMSATDDLPLYEVLPKAQARHGSSIDITISTEEEPLYRQFFAQVAQQCGRL